MVLAAESFSLFSPAPSDATGRHRVLHAVTPECLSAAEYILAKLIVRLEAAGHAVHCVSSGSRNTNCGFRNAGLVVEPAAIGGFGNLLAPQRLQRAAKRFRADFIHTHQATAGWWAGWSERFGGTRSLGHVHEFASAVWHRQQTHLIAVSQAVKDHLVEQGIPSERVSVIRHAVDPDEISPRQLPAVVRECLGAAPNALVVGCFAHLAPHNGWDAFFDAIPTVLRTFPRAQFWCVGDGPLWDSLKLRARREGFAERMRFTGPRNDTTDLMRAADIVVFPARGEACPVVCIEAGLLGRPVVGCLSGGTPELIVHHDTGLLVPPRDANSLAQAILTLLDNPDLCRQLGRRGRQRALSEFTWPRLLRELDEIYQKMRDY